MANELICLDTSVLIDYFRKTNKENSFLFELYPNRSGLGKLGRS
jgi:predicted nucleic acid-binding protein